MAAKWKRGRGKLGFLDPLLGVWVAEAESPRGPLRCERTFERVLGGNYVRLEALWQFGPELAGKGGGEGGYREVAMIGAPDGAVRFWSFTSDGKRSEGEQADVSELHAEAVGFTAQMPAGLARMAYWPADDGGMIWVVEARNARGWKRFTEHHYHRR